MPPRMTTLWPHAFTAPNFLQDSLTSRYFQILQGNLAASTPLFPTALSLGGFSHNRGISQVLILNNLHHINLLNKCMYIIHKTNTVILLDKVIRTFATICCYNKNDDDDNNLEHNLVNKLHKSYEITWNSIYISNDEHNIETHKCGKR